MITKLVCASALVLGTVAASKASAAQPPMTKTYSAPAEVSAQATAPADAELTRRIRQEVMARHLSLQAKNVSVVTVDGDVILKGVVPTNSERDTIGKIARGLSPNVRNDLTVPQVRKQ